MTAKVFCLLLLLTALASLAAGELPVTSYGDRDTGTITGIVRNTYNHPVQSATVSCGDVADTTDTSGSYRLTLPPGYWTLTVSHPLYVTFVRPAVPVTEGETTYCNFMLQLPPAWFHDSFEDHEDFALEFAPWTCVDVDLSDTAGIGGTSWPHAGEPQAFIVFNPTATIPPLTEIQAHSGSKMAASFPATIPPSWDWLISPPLSGADYFNFWARSLNADNGLERFKVGVSTTGTVPQSFAIISGPLALEAPAAWTEYSFDLSGFDDGVVFVGIHHCTNGGSAFLVDSVNSEDVPVADESQTPAVTGIQGNYPNPFNPETRISYSLGEAGPVELGVFDLRGRKVKTLVSADLPSGHHNIIWNGIDDAGQSVASGVYLCKLRAGGLRSCHKLVLMK